MAAPSRDCGYAPDVADPHTSFQERIEAAGCAMVTLAEVVDDNLRSVLLAMTTESSVTESLRLQTVTPVAEGAQIALMTFLARETPVARDLRWAMAMIRLIKDYERVADLTGALMERVVRLTDTLHEETVRQMTEVMRGILKLHGLMLGALRPCFMPRKLPLDALAKQARAVDFQIQSIEATAADALAEGLGSAEELRELVLATRHLTRITDQLFRMPEELVRVLPGDR